MRRNFKSFILDFIALVLEVTTGQVGKTKNLLSVTKSALLAGLSMA